MQRRPRVPIPGWGTKISLLAGSSEPSTAAGSHIPTSVGRTCLGTGTLDLDCPESRGPIVQMCRLRPRGQSWGASRGLSDRLLCFAGLSCSQKSQRAPLPDSQGTLPRVHGAGLGKGPRRLPPPLLLLPPFLVPSPWHSPTLPTKFVPTDATSVRVPGATRSPGFSPLPNAPREGFRGPSCGPSLKRQGFQGKVAAQDGVPCPSAMTLTLEGQAGVGGAGCQPQGPRGGVV